MGKREHGVNERDLEQLSNLFRLLSDRTRLTILMRLLDGECNVSTLCDELSLPQPTISHHLGLLRMNNIVSNRRIGKHVFYGIHEENDDGAVLQFSVQHLTVQVHPRV